MFYWNVVTVDSTCKQCFNCVNVQQFVLSVESSLNIAVLPKLLLPEGTGQKQTPNVK